MKGKREGPPDNREIAELLALEVENASPVLQRAFRRASRSAFLWPEQARDLVAQDRSLTELAHVGPFLEKRIYGWIRSKKHPEAAPAIRQDFLTMAEARVTLDKTPKWRERLRGDLQMHTRWSDGSGEIRAMADAARALNYEYIAITDHSKGLSIANGLNEMKLARQRTAIDAVNRKLNSEGIPFQVLRSIELNLNPKGEGDMEPAALKKLDLVLGSFHSSLRRKEDQTERYVAALRNPHIQILGHPRGRIYNYRVGLTADWGRVFSVAARLDKAVEIDAYPDRQDLNLALLKVARRCGTRISLGTDAHHPWQLEFISLGLAAALSARIPAERIINFMPVKALLEWVKSVRRA